MVPKDRRAGSPRRRRDKTTIALVIAAAAVWLVAGYFASTRKQEPSAVPTASLAATTAAPAASSATMAPSAAPTAASVIDVDACMRSLFPDKSFNDKTRNLEFVCSQADAVRGVGEIKSILIVAGKGGVTQGMRDWAGLEWYSLPAFSLLRVKCCTSPPQLTWAQKPSCAVDKALEQLEKAIADDIEDDIETAIAEYGKMARCLEQFNQARAFGQAGPPGAGATALKRFRQRAAKAK